MATVPPIIRRISEALGGDPALLEALTRGLPPRDLRSLLLYVLAERALARDALTAADAFDAIDLPPVVPHGATFALSGVHPNNVLATMRGFEVMGDPTI